jgi:nitrate reductase (NAD(P)H)
MVKWLEEISVAPEESQNFYHFHDNRVLPPGIDQEKAKAEGGASLDMH